MCADDEMQAVDISHFTSHLKDLLTSSNTSGPIYVDLPDTPGAPSRGPKGARTAKTIVNFLTGSSSGVRRTALDLGLSSKKSDYDAVVSLLSGSGGSSGRTVRSLREQVEKWRIIKSEAEVRVMRRCADISANAHARVMRLAQADGNMSEGTLVAEFQYACARQGAGREAYIPVCAAGANSTYLHYTANNCVLQENDLVLLDAGAEYAGYASDITRTFPVSGRFSEPQRDLYAAVLRTLRECTALCAQRHGVNLYDLHDASRRILTRELRQIGLDLGANEALFDRVYPHFVGHPVGLDLHDCPTFQRHTRLDEGNVLAVEPGVM